MITDIVSPWLLVAGPSSGLLHTAWGYYTDITWSLRFPRGWATPKYHGGAAARRGQERIPFKTSLLWKNAESGHKGFGQDLGPLPKLGQPSE